ncbi:MAG: hypothetical protein ABT940_11780, partial [Alphaproteobacteria bacterium]
GGVKLFGRRSGRVPAKKAAVTAGSASGAKGATATMGKTAENATPVLVAREAAPGDETGEGKPGGSSRPMVRNGKVVPASEPAKAKEGDPSVQERRKTALVKQIQDLTETELQVKETLSRLQTEADRQEIYVTKLTADVADLTHTREMAEKKVSALLARQRELERSIAAVERAAEAARKEKMEELEAAIAAQKEIELNKIMSWSSEEKARLQHRFDQEYRAQSAVLRRELVENVNSEFDKIRDYLVKFASDRRTIVEKDLQNFLAEKQAAILSGLE